MKLLFKQRFFSWFDSYDIFDEFGNVVFVVKGQLSWGHRLNIYNSAGLHIGTVKEVVFTWLPKFELYEGNRLIGVLKKKFEFFRNSYNLDLIGWSVDGDLMGWDYNILDSRGGAVARVNKVIFNFTDTYEIDVVNPASALYALMFTLAIDAEKCSHH